MCFSSDFNEVNELGGGWSLVRRVTPSYLGWHPADDRLVGSSSYSQLSGTYSMYFEESDYNEFLFALGDFSAWIIIAAEELYKVLFT